MHSWTLIQLKTSLLEAEIKIERRKWIETTRLIKSFTSLHVIFKEIDKKRFRVHTLFTTF